MIEFVKYSDLPVERKSELDSLIHTEFGGIPFVNNTQWATPDWTVLMTKDREIVTFLNIVIREVIIDQANLVVAGINNVITPKKHRGHGYASKLLIASHAYIHNDLNLEHALLLCADAVIPFYTRLDWYPVKCDVCYTHPTGKIDYDSNTLLLS